MVWLYGIVEPFAFTANGAVMREKQFSMQLGFPVRSKRMPAVSFKRYVSAISSCT